MTNKATFLAQLASASAKPTWDDVDVGMEGLDFTFHHKDAKQAVLKIYAHAHFPPAIFCVLPDSRGPNSFHKQQLIEWLQKIDPFEPISSCGTVNTTEA
jgi:hypothetical protein